jgi:hypothetical protein
LEEGDRRIWHCDSIAGIADANVTLAENIPVRFNASMKYRNRSHFNATDESRAVNANASRANISLIGIGRIKGPRIHALKDTEGLWRAVDGETVRALPTKGSEVVKARNVIEMAVRIDDGIDRADAFAEGLLPKIGGRVDKESSGTVINNNRRAEAFIFGRGGLADLTLATDERNTCGGSRSQK